MANPTDSGRNTPAEGGSAISFSFNTTRTIVSGERIWVIISWFGTQTLSSFSGGGLTWTIDSQQANGSQHIGLAYADAPSGLTSGTTITGTLSATAAASGHIASMAGTGWSTGAALARNSATMSGASYSSGTVSVATGDVLVGGISGGDSPTPGGGNNTPSGGNTEVHDYAPSPAAGSMQATEYQIGSGTSIAISGTGTPADLSGATLAVSFAAAAAGPSLAPSVNPDFKDFPKFILAGRSPV